MWYCNHFFYQETSFILRLCSSFVNYYKLSAENYGFRPDYMAKQSFLILSIVQRFQIHVQSHQVQYKYLFSFYLKTA